MSLASPTPESTTVAPQLRLASRSRLAQPCFLSALSTRTENALDILSLVSIRQRPRSAFALICNPEQALFSM